MRRRTGPSSHISQCACQGPADARTTCPTEAKTASPAGLGSIAEQQVDHRLRRLPRRRPRPLRAAARRRRHDERHRLRPVEGLHATSDAEPALDGVTLARRRRRSSASSTAGNMTTEFKPLFARTARTRRRRGRDVQVRATTDRASRTEREPSLPAMTDEGDRRCCENRKDGFFLQVEGASIDKRDHAADVCGQIGETLALRRRGRRRARLPGAAPGHARRRHRRPLAHDARSSAADPDTPGSYATLQTADGAADPRLLRHRPDAGRPDPHRRPRAGRGDRPAGRQRHGRRSTRPTCSRP